MLASRLERCITVETDREDDRKCRRLPHGNAGVQAGEMHHRIGHTGGSVLTRLHNDGEPLWRELDLIP